MEKRRAQELMVALDDQRGGKAITKVVESVDENTEFWNLLGGHGQIVSAAAGGEDEVVKTDVIKLFRYV